MAWAKRVQSRAAADLAVSGMPSCTWEDLALDPRDLPLAEPNYYGLPRWRAAVAQRFRASEDGVVPVSGASSAIFAVVALFVRPGDRVVVESPGYGALRTVPTLFGAEVEVLPRPSENGFHLDLDRLAQLARRPPRLLLVSDLHNPSGSAFSEKEREALVRVAEDGDFTVLCDEVYREFLPDPPDPLFRRSLRVISAGSLTKAFGLGPLRAGWILASDTVAEGLRRVLDLAYVDNASLAEAAAAHALGRLDLLRARTRALLQPRRAVLDEWLRSRSDLMTVHAPEVPFAFPRLPAGLTGRRVSDLLLAERSTAVVPGEFFGDPRHMRISCAGLAPDALRTALDGVSEILDRLAEPRPRPPGGTV
jgi:aspartate/methionine/tyrosine aminotransferase